MPAPLSRAYFLKLAFLVEGGLILLAVGLAWWLEIPLADWLTWNPEAVAWGIGVTVPLCLFFAASYFWPFGSYRQIKDFLEEALGPSLAECRWFELVLVAALAGIGEEFLFRGVLQPWLEQWGPWVGLIVSNLVFGLCHAITITYALLAFAMGLILGLLFDAPDERSLLAPIITHGLYDLFAFLVVAYDWRRKQKASGETEQEEPPENGHNETE